MASEVLSAGPEMMGNITITSDSKNIEFYLDKMIYQSTVRGSKLDICAENGSINGLYKVAQSFPEPYPFFCTIKCLSLPNKKELHLHDVFITLAASTTSSCSSSKEAVSKPKIDMQQVQGIINSIGGPKADKVGQLLSTVQGNQKALNVIISFIAKNSGTSNLAQLFLSQLPLLRQEIAKPTTSTIEHQTGKNDVDLAKNDTKPTVDGKENSLLPMDKTVGSDANKEKADLSLIREYVDNAIERTSENIIKEINDKIESNNKAIVSRLDQITKQLELITSGKNVTENLEENGK
ncbi:uncharacterized protein TRIADDRAFT_61483 [Trichoplax adhaerens]|uniref:Uncharacterized protein n=1 Tax=Trichoplax adhaerens TaxID=10228 RepID=B3SB42_TRIAD|nr:predicted protein [Trichoplax adhaerens]EDV20098.1 predicted protein [Trichoplax adhaerens]|eukprot:XP_002117482.1 predicted protein [Trichoplax adhaerens]